MRKSVTYFLAALLVLAPAGASYAASPATPAGEQTVSGTVKAVDLIARSLQLDDGSWYFLPIGFDGADAIKVGDQVTVHWKPNGSAHDVTAVDIG